MARTAFSEVAHPRGFGGRWGSGTGVKKVIEHHPRAPALKNENTSSYDFAQLDLNKHEHNVIGDYSNPSYFASINGLLRNPGKISPEWSDADVLHAANDASTMQQAINRHLTLKDTVVYRGSNLDLAEAGVGTRLNDKGFTSTSTKFDVAQKFKDGALVEIHLPKGTPALHIGGPEGEVILPSDSTFKITGFGPGRVIVTIEPKTSASESKHVSADVIRDSSEMQNLLGDPSAHASKDHVVLGEIARQNKFDALPSVVSTASVNDAVAAGQPELLRSMTESAHAEQLKTGAYWPGRGIYGGGTYAFTPANNGTMDAIMRQGDKYGTTKVRMTLKPGVKLATFDDIQKLQEADLARLDGERKKLRKEGNAAAKRGEDTTALDLAEERMGDWIGQLRDPGVWAAANGHDAYVVEETRMGMSEVVVLNRGALLIDNGV